MKTPIILFLALIFTIPAFATIDPDPDQIGVYFDTNADVTCIAMESSVPFWVYVIITRPTSPEIHGVEFSLCEVVDPGMEGMLFRLSPIWENYNPDIMPVLDGDWCNEGVAAGFFGPIVPQGDNALLVSIQYMMIATMTVDFHLGPMSAPSIPNGPPAYLGAGDEIIPLGVSSGDPDLPVATVNGCSIIAVENVDFGSIKCLYR